MSNQSFYKPAATLLCVLLCIYCSAREANFNSSVYFIENKGQIVDQFRNPRNDIQFRLNTASNLNIFIGNGRISYQWYKRLDTLDRDNKPAAKHIRYGMYAVVATLLDADTNAQVFTEEQQDYHERYFQPQCPNGITARTFKKIVYKNVYPNIDWVIYVAHPNSRGEEQTEMGEFSPSAGAGGGFKYDFIVHPGGDPSDIKLKYEAADNLQLQEGVLSFSSPFGSLQEQAPYTYDNTTKQKITSSFALHDNILGFDVAPYNTNNTIIIDPAINWVDTFGADAATYGYAIAKDAAGNTYLAGTTTDGTLFNIASFPAGYQQYNNGNSDMYIEKMALNGTRIWGTFFGWANYETVSAITCDTGLSYIYLTGTILSDSIGTSGTHQRYIGGMQDAFLFKFQSNGGPNWLTYYGGSANDNAYTIACDKHGDVYIGGYTQSNNAIASSGAFQTNLSFPSCGFLAKFNAAGSMYWGTYYNGIINSISIDTADNPFIGGRVYNTQPNISTAGTHQTAFGGGAWDGFIAKFTPTGSRIWATYYGDKKVDEVVGVVYDPWGYVWAAGNTYSDSNIATAGTYQPVFSGDTVNTSGFVAKLNANTGTRVFGTYCDSLITGIACDPAGQAWTSGKYLALLRKNGTKKWSVYRTDDSSKKSDNAIHYSMGKISLASSMLLYPKPPPPPAIPPNIPPHLGGTATQYDGDTVMFFYPPYTDTILCQGVTYHWYIDVTNKFRATNNFIVQLSDSSGSFASPVNMGTNHKNGADTLSFTIPNNTIPGANYRLRVLATAPADTIPNNLINVRISEFPNPMARAHLPVCAAASLYLFDTGSSPATTIYKWTGPMGSLNYPFPICNVPNMKFADSGYYLLTADNLGCIRKDSVHITVQPNPDPISVTSNSPVCAGDTLRVFATTAATPVTWYWQKPAGYVPNTTGDTTIPNAAATDAGDYIAIAVLNGCFSNPDTETVIINPVVIPTLQVTASPGTTVLPGTQITFTATGITNGGLNPSYQWFKNGIYITGATSTTYSAIMTIDLHTGDSICLQMTSSADCPRPTAVTACASVLQDLSVSSEKINGLQLFPNPNKGSFAIRYNETLRSAAEVEITNPLGQTIYTKRIATAQDLYFDLGDIPNGIYSLKFKTATDYRVISFSINR